MILFGYKTKKERIIRDIIFIALGILFLFFPGGWFSSAVFLIGIRIIGVILLLLGLLEGIVLYGAMSLTGVGFLPFVMALGTILFGLLMLFTSGEFKLLKWICGIALLWYGLSDLISGWKIAQAVDEYEIKRTREAPRQQPSSEGFTISGDLDSVKEAEYRKEDE